MGSNCEQLCRDNILCLRLEDNHSPMEETEPYGTDAKTDKMAASKPSQGLGMLRGAFVWKIPVMMQYSSVLHHPRHPLGMPSGISRLRI